ncbi:MAG: anaerobic ribonucleoside-triphosphate reductase activating protein [Firmicutes bacterium]|nr:anaerobic ribonucleoside-triphosphate reductase activating protein [Bacillota bacterium]MCM1401710.1 anaerobic ribonucleoside-triphosphate reductase activating protein [Bacteroides sp.]MCM1477739.1 anaerobic ribonucleoside-triphosphate reductase activating protein [Bacteroides sp.]
MLTDSELNTTLRVVDFVDGTTVDGPGFRTSIYFAGCSHRCPGCHNPTTWDFQAGKEMTVCEILEHVERNGFDVTFSGGDPLYQAHALEPLARELRSRGYTVWCYTGFHYEELSRVPGAKELLRNVDVLVDGPFIEAQRSVEILFRGSTNQRLIDVKASQKENQPVLWRSDW